MTSMGWEVVHQEAPLFRRHIGELLAVMVRKRWPRHTAKQVAQAWDIDLKTAKNLVLGKVGLWTINKALQAEGWALLDALGCALTGQTHHEWEEQCLRKIVDEAERAQEGIRSLRARREQLAARAAALDAGGAGQGADGRRTG